MTKLFERIDIGEISLRNRVVMAPLTRSRAIEGNRASPLMAEYYRQRASAGLIISEATQICPMGQGYLNTPGIYSEEQVQSWRQVTDAVHSVRGRIVLQLWHAGRMAHSSLLPGGAAPVSSTNRQSSAMSFTMEGFVQASMPRALSDDEIPGVIDDFAAAARNAMIAGFDGVEVHAANTYLLDQFLRDSINDRTGPYGGSIQNRVRLVLEVVEAVSQEIGPGKTGIRISPLTTFGNTAAIDSNPQALYNHLIAQIAPMHLAYVHVVEGETGGPRNPEMAPHFDYSALRARFPGAWIANNGYSLEDAIASVGSGRVDAVAVGRAFICNPDLVQRWRDGAVLNDLRPDLLYGGGSEGYTDYPVLARLAT